MDATGFDNKPPTTVQANLAKWAPGRLSTFACRGGAPGRA
jgi:hypothetical protein